MVKKTKRRIVINDRVFYWFVAEDFEHLAWLGAKYTLTIFSDGKQFFIKYPIEQKCPVNHIVVIGSEFEGNGVFGKVYKRIECPIWEREKAIRPRIVREIIVWSLAPKDCMFVDYLGKPTNRDIV